MADPKKILIVDDEPDMVEWLQAFLEDHGFKTIVAYNGVDGLAMAEAERPDLITLDISMDRESGVKMFRRLHESPDLTDIPVFLVTGVASEFKGFIERSSKVKNPTAYFEKPVDKEKLLAAIRDVLKIPETA